jgi:hypothetical protein
MDFATRSIDGVLLRKQRRDRRQGGGRSFKVSTVSQRCTREGTFAGRFFDEYSATPFRKVAYRSHDDELLGRQNVIDAINRIGKSRIVIAGLWTSVCVVGPALSAWTRAMSLRHRRRVRRCNSEAHDRAMDRMVQAGARPMTACSICCELQRDWARSETYGSPPASPSSMAGAMDWASPTRSDRGRVSTSGRTHERAAAAK